MSWRRLARIFALCTIAWLCSVLPAAAAPYYGRVTYNGMPVPGATITATRDGQKFTAVTNLGGVYQFSNLADGVWKIAVQMQMFSAIHAQVIVGPKTPVSNWKLMPLPMNQLAARARKEANAPAASAVHLTRPQARHRAEANVPEPPPPTREKQLSANGFLVNGSENNAATSVYSTNPAFGNSRATMRSLYNGGFATIVDNSALDARPFAVSGVEAPKDNYTHVTTAFQFGGPLNIPRLMPRGPIFFLGYEWSQDNSAIINTGLVPTLAERSGNLSSLPVTIYDPATGLPYAKNQVPVSPQAQALLKLYPLPDSNISSASGYNYQAPVLNDLHQNVLQLRLSKNIGRRDNIYGNYNYQNTAADNVNLFGFLDATDTLGMDANLHWLHRYGTHFFITTSYSFSRLRTQVTPYFEKRTNISGNAGITGNDQDAANWGPPSLSFTSGIYPLSDATSSFDRNRTDAISVDAYLYHGNHNFSLGFDFTKLDDNESYQADPRGQFTFTGAATSATGRVEKGSGSDLADFLIGVPDDSAIAYGNADKYFREPIFDAYFNDDWRVAPAFTINGGLRWRYSAPMTELHGRLVNLDIANGFTAAAPVLGSDPVGAITGQHFPASLMRPDWKEFEPRIGIAWRPFAASSVVVRAGYGIYYDTAVYFRIDSLMAQQAPLSKSLNVQNSSACPLTLADGFPACSTTTSDQFAVNPNFLIGYAQTWDMSIQRDLPFAMQMTVTYLGIKGTHGPQEILPNSYPIGEANPCPDCPSGFVYETSGGNSTREAGELQLRRRLMNGFAASIMYTYSKSIDDDAYLGGAGHVEAGGPGQAPTAAASGYGHIAQNWLDPEAERSLSSFDQRQILNVTAQYTSGEGLHGGALMRGWKRRMLSQWTLTTTISAGTGFPETPIYPATVPGTGFNNTIRPDLTGASIYNASASRHLNAAAYTAPVAGQWGTAGRNSITGPNQFTLNSSMQRTFPLHGKLSLDLQVDATNLLNHATFTSWNRVVGNAQFGLPVSAGAMRSLQTIVRLRF